MTVYLGEDGFVELRRTGTDSGTGDQQTIVRDYITPDDVNTEQRRFSVQRNSTNGYFMTTGDRVSILPATPPPGTKAVTRTTDLLPPRRP